ncbi:MAG: lipopolysaccharide heptosyltransferase I, partial [Oceanobacter sp.]
IIPVAWRRWRKKLHARSTWKEMARFRRRLRSNKYDLVIDAQGLIKSGVIAGMALGRSIGLDSASCREPAASVFYRKKVSVAKGEHAIHRLRKLFAGIFDYKLSETMSYGIDKSRWLEPKANTKYWVFLHGTTWETKLWPESYWSELAAKAVSSGINVYLPWGTEDERIRAANITKWIDGAEVLPRMDLDELIPYLAFADGIVGVDTGLSHVAAAMEVPSIALYGATDTGLTGALGPKMRVLKSELSCAPCLSRQCKNMSPELPYPPCYKELPPERVFMELSAMQKLPLYVG